MEQEFPTEDPLAAGVALFTYAEKHVLTHRLLELMLEQGIKIEDLMGDTARQLHEQLRAEVEEG